MPHIGAFAELHAGLNDIPLREISAWSANPLMSLMCPGYGKEQGSSVDRERDTSTAA